MSFVVLNCQVVEGGDIFANPVFKNPGINRKVRLWSVYVFFNKKNFWGQK